MRPSWIEIDLDAIENNAREIAAHIAPSELCAVVKADGYGHGDIPVARAALAGGAGLLAVALVEEGVRLREADIDVPILILSEPTPPEVPSIITHGLVPTAYTATFVDQIADAAEDAAAIPYPVHLKLDSGMHRVGTPPVDAFEIARKIDADGRLTLQGVFTHFAVADDDPDYTRTQNRELERFADALQVEGIVPTLLHAANTAAAFGYPETHHDMCRVGLGLYGLRPTAELGKDIDLMPAMRVVSEVRYVRTLPAHARPSYGRIRELDGTPTVATVPIGYADGVNRSLSGPGAVLINGKRYRFAGQITMDMVIIDLGDDEAHIGDEVVLIGSQGDEAITVEQWADMLGTISYEVVCHFGPRLPRRYVRSRRDDA